MKSRFWVAFSALLCAVFSGVSPHQAAAQGRPDLVWMRGAGINGKVGGSSIASRAVSPDGKLLLTSDRYKTVLWRLSDGMVLRTVEYGGGWVAFTPDGASIVGAFGNVLRVWKVSDGSKRLEIAGLSGNATCIAVSPDGAVAAIGLDSGVAEVRSIATGALVGTYGDKSEGIWSIAYSPNGLRFVMGTAAYSSSLTVWNTVTGAQMYRIRDSSEYRPYVVAVSADSRHFYTRYGDYGFGSFDIETGNLVYGATFYDAVDIAVSPDGRVAASAQNGATVFTADLSHSVTLAGPFYGTPSLAFLPDASALITVSSRNTGEFPSTGISLWRSSDGTQLKQLTPESASAFDSGFAISPDGKLIASSGAGGFNLRRADDGAFIRNIPANWRGLAFSPDGSLIASSHLGSGGQRGAAIAIRRVADGALVADIPNIEVNVVGLTFSQDGKLIGVSNADGTSFYGVPDGNLVHRFPQAGLIALTPGGSLLAIYDGDNDHTMFIYRMSDWSLVRSFEARYDGVLALSMAISPDGKLIALGGYTNPGGGAILLNIADGALVAYMPGDAGATTAVAFSPDGQVLLTGTNNQKIRFWSVPLGSPLLQYDQEIGSVGAITYSPDGKYFYYGRNSYDGTLCGALNPYRNAVFPSRGGNSGNVTVKIVTAPDFPAGDGTTITLHDNVDPDITIPTVRVSDFVLTGTFDLNGAPIGMRDLIITSPLGTRTYPQGFSIDPGMQIEPTAEIIGRRQMRGGVPSVYFVNAANTGNVDAQPVNIGFGFTQLFGWLSGSEPAVPIETVDNTVLLFDLGTVGALSTHTSAVTLYPPDSPAATHREFRLSSWTGAGNAASSGTNTSSGGGPNSGSAPILCIPSGFPSSGVLDGGLHVSAVLGDHVRITFTSVKASVHISVFTNYNQHQVVDLAAPPGGSASGSVDFFVFGTCVPWVFDMSSSAPVLATIETDNCGCSGGGFDVGVVTSMDPNELTGSPGIGVLQWLSGTNPVRYATFFSNQQSATAPASRVIVTDQLDATLLDTATVQIGAITFAGQTVIPELDKSLPVGQRTYSADVDLRPGKNLIVHLTASLDMLSGELTWTFQSLDPATMMPPSDPLAGFLGPGEEGSVFVSIVPKASAPTGTVVTNQASVVFDANAPMSTNVWFNTIDNTPPVSHVQPLPGSEVSRTFNVQWTAADAEAGVRDFSVYVSDNGGPYAQWLANTTLTSSSFTGQPTHTYSFYSTARDNVFNVETAHTEADTFTTVINTDTSAPTTIATINGAIGQNGWYTGPVTVTLAATDPDDAPAGSGSDVAATYYTVDGGTQQTYATPVIISGDAVHALTFWSVDKAGNEETPHKALTIKIDSTPPSLIWGAPTPAANAAGWSNTPLDIPYTTADNLSGVASAVPGSPVHFGLEGKNQTQSVKVMDVAGNSTSFTSPAVNIDMTAPVTTSNVTGPAGRNGWYVGPVQVTLSATDNLSGVSQTLYTVNGGAPQIYTAPLVLANDGIYTLSFWSADAAGNTETAKTLTVKLDQTPPAVNASANPATLWPPNGKMDSVTVTGTVTDNLSGVDPASTSFSVVDSYGAVQPSGPVTVNADGTYSFTIQLEARRNGADMNGRTYTITVRACDLAGNQGAGMTVVTVPHDQRR